MRYLVSLAAWRGVSRPTTRFPRPANRRYGTVPFGATSIFIAAPV